MIPTAPPPWYARGMRLHVTLLLLLAVGCDEAAANARRVIHDEHAGRVHEIVEERCV